MTLQAPLSRYVVEDRGYLTPCWIWQGKPDPKTGYGHLRVGGVQTSPHRVSYEHAKGPIPHDHQIDHCCRVRLCINPDHLDAVTPTENNRRRPWCKLTPVTADAIRERCAAILASMPPVKRTGNPRQRLPQGAVTEIADEFGVSIWTVMDVRRRTWL